MGAMSVPGYSHLTVRRGVRAGCGVLKPASRSHIVFVTWKGDHSPYHVHVYRDGTLVLKWDLENQLAMRGKPTNRILRLITELSEEGLL